MENCTLSKEDFLLRRRAKKLYRHAKRIAKKEYPQATERELKNSILHIITTALREIGATELCFQPK